MPSNHDRLNALIDQSVVHIFRRFTDQRETELVAIVNGKGGLFALDKAIHDGLITKAGLHITIAIGDHAGLTVECFTVAEQPATFYIAD